MILIRAQPEFSSLEEKSFSRQPAYFSFKLKIKLASPYREMDEARTSGELYRRGKGSANQDR